jgi:flagellar hook-associated protein 1 FlgK
VNLVEYQNMYQANMKVMSVANALFDATLAMMA